MRSCYGSILPLLLHAAAVVTPACLPVSAAEPADASGSRALPGGRRSLADLLRQAEEQAGNTAPTPPQERLSADRPSQTQAPPPQPDATVADLPTPSPSFEINWPQAGVENLPALIRQRHRIIDDCRFFETLARIVDGERMLPKFERAVQVAQAAVARAQASGKALNAAGAGFVPAEAKGAAAQAVTRAEATLAEAQAALERHQDGIRTLIDKVASNVEPWIQAYRGMRDSVPHRRSDPSREAVLATLEKETADRDDFLEGHILAALCHAYDGNEKKCAAHLAAAITFIDRYPPLLSAQVTHDCAYVAILADRPHLVNNYVKLIKGMPPEDQSAPQQWLVATFAVATKAEPTAATYFRKALTGEGFHRQKKRGKPPRIDPILAGDAAHFFLTRKKPSAEDRADAALLVQCRDPDNSWQLLRAKAALAASEDRWPEAQQQIAACRRDCPLTLEEQIEKQAAAYGDEKIWSR
jgi:hypothetical protein